MKRIRYSKDETAEQAAPSPADATGRDSRGRFGPGNKCGKGNPLARRAQTLRFALLAAVRPEDVHRILWRMIKLALRGDIAAARIVLDRVFGRVADPYAVLSVEQEYDPDEIFD
jgi:hypothetical protein